MVMCDKDTCGSLNRHRMESDQCGFGADRVESNFETRHLPLGTLPFPAHYYSYDRPVR